MSFKIGARIIDKHTPTYFIADIASNHDGDLRRAKDLISRAKDAGADGAKFQHFIAEKIVSQYGFDNLGGGQLSHQKKWAKSVFEVYRECSIPREWTASLKQHCDKERIDFFSAPYDMEAIDMLDNHVSVYKIGSGDITWLEIIDKMAQTGKPLILATGASTLEDVTRAVSFILSRNKQLALLQCNTNYTGSDANFKCVSLNVLKKYERLFPDLVLGLSDHTPGHAAVLGAVALGARIIEKHFTDDNDRKGPDHPFSMNPRAWREMVERTRELELSLGSSAKIIEENEKETVVIQRRCVRAAEGLKVNEHVTRAKVEVLRPAPQGAIMPYEIDKVIGRKIRRKAKKGEALTWDMFREGDIGNEN